MLSGKLLQFSDMSEIWLNSFCGYSIFEQMRYALLTTVFKQPCVKEFGENEL